MIKRTVTYTDFDGNVQTDEVYFHLSKQEFIDLTEMEAEVRSWAERFNGEERELTSEEIRGVLALVRKLGLKGYGERSADGKRFVKSAQLAEEFSQTALWDEFLFSLFQNPDELNQFLVSLVPTEYREQSAARNNVQAQPRVIEVPLPEADQNRAANVAELQAQLSSLTPEQIQELLNPQE
jgi:hypothetical protein